MSMSRIVGLAVAGLSLAVASGASFASVATAGRVAQAPDPSVAPTTVFAPNASFTQDFEGTFPPTG